MTIEEVAKKALINFETPITVKETEKLLKYISEEVSLQITYKTVQNNVLYYDKNKGVTKWNLLNSIDGSVDPIKGKITFNEFKSLPLDSTPIKVMAIQFSYGPSFTKLKQYTNEVKIWDKTRKAVNKYFKNR